MMYDPQQLEREYEMLERGKSRIAAMYAAIQQADENHDLTYQLAFRLDLCQESCFYADSMDMLIVFPQALALVDKYPNIPLPPDIRAYKDSMDYMIRTYKFLLCDCCDYYQIPFEDCMKFFEDFKQRSISLGYNLKPYYKCLYFLYKDIDDTLAEQYFQEFQKLPTDRNGDCKACDRNCEIKYYLKKGRVDIADKLAEDIKNFRLFCGKRRNNKALLRLNEAYSHYYITQKDYEKAREHIRILERYSCTEDATEYEYDDVFMEYYAYVDIGKALKIYKRNWKSWSTERLPITKLDTDESCFLFFRELGKKQESGTIKLELDSTFPLYNAEGVYNIQELERFYYKSAMDIAMKFDKRNGASHFQNRLIKKRSDEGPGEIC